MINKKEKRGLKRIPERFSSASERQSERGMPSAGWTKDKSTFGGSSCGMKLLTLYFHYVIIMLNNIVHNNNTFTKRIISKNRKEV